jgi:hypothetical protein
MTERPVAKSWVPGWVLPGIFGQPKHLNKIIFVFHKEWGISVQNCSTKLVDDMAITESIPVSGLEKYSADAEREFTVPVGDAEKGHLKEGGHLTFFVACEGAFSKSVVATLR